MPVPEGSGARDFTAEVNHVTNGDPGNQNTFRAATTDLEKRTNALLDFVNSLEDFVHKLLGTSETSIAGVQGQYNTEHVHDGSDSVRIDLQQVYNNNGNGGISGLVMVDTGAINITLGLASTVNFIASDGSTSIMEIDNDTQTVTVKNAVVVSP